MLELGFYNVLSSTSTKSAIHIPVPCAANASASDRLENFLNRAPAIPFTCASQSSLKQSQNPDKTATPPIAKD